MAPKYKLTYFNARGRAEIARLMFAYGGVEYEDVRIPYTGTTPNPQWEELKPKTPFGQLPILEINGEMYSQSGAFGRYLARELGLDGKDSIEKLKVDMVIDALEDMQQSLGLWWREEDPVKKEALLKKYTDEIIPKYLNRFEKMVASTGEFITGKSVTYADFALAHVVSNLASFIKQVDFSKYPAVMKLQKKVFDLPGVKEWVQKRPATDF